MNTPSEREAALRRALLSAAEQIEPTPGGLERIQARLARPRPLPVAWLGAAWTLVVMRSPDVIEAIRRRAAKVLGLVWERFGPRSVPGPGNGPQQLSWLRPLVAMSVAVFVIGAGIYVGLASPAAIFATGGVSPGAQGGGGPHPGGSARSGQGKADGSASGPAYSVTPGSSGSSTACPTSVPRFQGPPKSSSSRPTTPSTSPSTPSPSPSSPSPSVSPSSSPGDSTPPTSGSVASPEAGQASANPTLLGSGTSTGTTDSARGGTSATKSGSTARSKNGSSDNSQNDTSCPTTTSGRKHHKKTSTARLTSAQLARAKRTQTSPGGAVEAKLD
jgi:hypothetical protein